MTSPEERLVYMANQIARNFATQGDEAAALATADHIATFRDLRMRTRILAMPAPAPRARARLGRGGCRGAAAHPRRTSPRRCPRRSSDRSGTAAVSMPADVVCFERIDLLGAVSTVERAVADETPIALEINGFGYAVLMASATDLEDLVVGFLRSERLIDELTDLLDIGFYSTARGVIARATLVSGKVGRLLDRVRHRTSESSCGLCGLENLEQAMRPLPLVLETSCADATAIFAALAILGEHQAENKRTGAVHAAALCDARGAIRLVREDVGRHNALDKLLGAMLREELLWSGGFALVTSRCSFELVEKAVLAGCPLLAAISAPTGLALERARAAGLRLVVLARRDALLAVPE